jgi:Transposase DDE domain
MALSSDRDLPEWPEPVIGGKYVRLLQKELDRLRGEEEHGNRKLFLDDVFVVYLLAFFNPAVRSLRTLEDLSQTRQAQKHLSLSKVCKSTLSDFNALSDPARLQPLLEALSTQLARKQARQPQGGSGDLHELLQKTVAVDGTFLPAAAQVAWAVAERNNHGAVRHRARVDAHVNVATWLPEVLVVPEPQQSEADSAIAHLQAGRISVYDRGYMSYALLKAHHQTPDANFVVRFKPEGTNASPMEVTFPKELSEEDLAAGVTRDLVGRFATDSSERAGIADAVFREVVVTYDSQEGEPQTLRLITDLLEVPASTVATLYRWRWQVELFFRWLKTLANFDHLISHSRQGVQTHLYVTVIATMLMYLHTGCRPSKYLFTLLSQVAAGGATLDEVLPILRERERRCELDRQSRARRAAKKKANNA